MSGGVYARRTDVSSEASRAEIEGVLRRYGADQFGSGWDGPRVHLVFRIAERQVRFSMVMPEREETRFTTYKRGYTDYRYAEAEIDKRWEQAQRQKWRALVLVIKAKLEAAAAGITTIEEEFLAHTVLSDGRTVGEMVRPQLAEHYRLGGAPALRLEGPKP